MENLAVHLGVPRDGWAVLRVDAAGQQFELPISSTPRDTLAAFANVSTFMRGPYSGTRVVTANTEPEEYDFHFERGVDPDVSRLVVRRYRDHRRVAGGGTVCLSLTAPAEAIGRAFSSAVSEVVTSLGPEAYAVAWGHSPP